MTTNTKAIQSSSSPSIETFPLESDPHMIPPRHSQFISRDLLKSRIHQAFVMDKVKTLVLLPPEGVYCKTGKTELAKDYALTYQESFSKVIWIHPEEPFHAESFSENEDTLVILDDQKYPDQKVHQIKGHLLITSRNREGYTLPNVHKIDVGGFSLEIACAFLMQEFPGCTQDDVRPVATMLGCVPSSLVRATQYMIEKGISPKEYPLNWLVSLEKNSEYLKERSNLPERNSNFIGREMELVAIEESMDFQRPLVIAAEVGLGGIGKSQIALQYAYRSGSHYQLVWLIQSENESSLIASYASLATHLNISLPEEGEKHTVIKKVTTHLEKHGNWLLIFDDAPNPEPLRDLLPKCGGHVIITSRNTDWRSFAHVFKVGVFSPQEAVGLIMKITQLHEQEPDAKELSRILQYFPLAISQASYYILETKISIADYIKKFQEKRQILWKFEIPPQDYYKTVQVTWNITLETIIEREESCTPYILPLMQFCSFMGPHNIPRALVLQNWMQQKDKTESSFFKLNRALGLLDRYSMITLNKTSVNIHALVQTVIRDTVPPKEQVQLLTETVSFLETYQLEKENVPIFSYWDRKPLTNKRLYNLLPHVNILVSHLENVKMPSEAAKLLTTVGSFSYHQGNLKLAEETFSRALSLEFNQGRSRMLGLVYLGLGDIKQAIPHIQKSGDTDSLIQLLMTSRDFDNAELLLKDQIKKLKNGPKVLGQTAVEYFLGYTLKRLGWVLLANNKDPKEAIEHLKEAKKMFDIIDGPNNGSSADTHMLTAQAYQKINDFGQAIVHLELARAYYESAIDKEHPDTIHKHLIVCLKSLGQLYLKEDLPKAESCLNHVLQIAGIKYGQTSAQTLEISQESASIYYSASRVDQAIHVYESITKKWSSCQTAFHNLGCLHQIKGFPDKAETNFLIALSLNPHSGIYTEYANFLSQRGRNTEAIPYLLQALDLESDSKGLMYGMIEMMSLPQEFHEIIMTKGTIQFDARQFAYYLLIKAYLNEKQDSKAKELYPKFEKEVQAIGGESHTFLLKHAYDALTPTKD